MDYFIITKAFFLALGLIVAIGAQNIYIIKVGLQKEKVFLAASIAGLCDTALIILGTLFMSRLIDTIPGFVSIARWAGIIFLTYYGIASLINGLEKKPKGWSFTDIITEEGCSQKKSWLNIASATLAFSLLNPHVYLDTFLILGNVGSRVPSDTQLSFFIGAGGASFFWFYLTGFAAKISSKAFEMIFVVRFFEVVVAGAMFTIAYGLYKSPIALNGSTEFF